MNKRQDFSVTEQPCNASPIGYNVHTAADVQAMLAVMGLQSIQQLFDDVPAQVRLMRDLDLPPALTEWALMRDVRAMADMNAGGQVASADHDGAVVDQFRRRDSRHDETGARGRAVGRRGSEIRFGLEALEAQVSEAGGA